MQVVGRDLCERHRILPVSRAGTSLIVAMIDPVEALRAATGLSIEPVIASDAAIAAAIVRYYG